MNTDTKYNTWGACKPNIKGLCSSLSIGKKGFYDYMRLQLKFWLLKYSATRKHVDQAPIFHPYCRLPAAATSTPLLLFGINWGLVVEEFAALRHLYLVLYNYSYIIAASGIQPLEASWELMETQCSVFTWRLLGNAISAWNLHSEGIRFIRMGAGREEPVENYTKCK